MNYQTPNKLFGQIFCASLLFTAPAIIFAEWLPPGMNILMPDMESALPVEEILPGTRVRTVSEVAQQTGSISPNTDEWHLISFQCQTDLGHSLEITKLMTIDELALQDATTTGSSFIIDIPNVTIGGPATVSGIQANPMIDSGAGEVVTMAARLFNSPRDFTTIGFFDLDDPMTVSSSQLVWSESISGWKKISGISPGTDSIKLWDDSVLQIISSQTSIQTYPIQYFIEVSESHKFYGGYESILLSDGTQ